MYMEQEGGPPAPLEPVGGSVDDICFMIQCMTTMISRIMKHTINKTDVEESDRTIKIFLSSFDRVDCNFKYDLPSWGTLFNFICLLNLPTTMNTFGPLRNFWEGGSQGEGFLVMVKPELSTGLCKNWQTNLMKKVLQK